MAERRKTRRPARPLFHRLRTAPKPRPMARKSRRIRQRLRRSKLAGDTANWQVGGAHVILRLCWFNAGKQFHADNDTPGGSAKLRVVGDSRPTTAPDRGGHRTPGPCAPRATPTATGTPHCCAGQTSWHGFASAIIDRCRRPKRSAIRSGDYFGRIPTPTKRPAYSVITAPLEHQPPPPDHASPPRAEA